MWNGKLYLLTPLSMRKREKKRGKKRGKKEGKKGKGKKGRD